MRNKVLNIDRKVLYIVLGIVMISVLTLTVVYAALSTTLNINGNTQVMAASWDVYLDNVQLNSSSVSTTAPEITNKTTATFSTTLTKPGDFYEFTIDVVNNGTIDAMIASITKTPELTDDQKKYLNYIIEYQNGESITTKQLVSKKSFVRLKVKVEYRKDITSSDLPTSKETLNLSFKVNYVQSDNSNDNVTINNNGKFPKIISGDLKMVGSEVAIGDEHFYIISATDDSITMLAKYNLNVGNLCTDSETCPLMEKTSGIQDSTMIATPLDWGFPRYGTTIFSSIGYWDNSGLKIEYGTDYPAYVYDSNSVLYNYVENYRIYLESQGAKIEEARLIKKEELETLGCSTVVGHCDGAPEWVRTSSYWTGTAYDFDRIWVIVGNGIFANNYCGNFAASGVRPVVVVKL